ncbi:MAG: DUF1549 domain-containing protein [Pirellulaceae bacterium]
MGACGWVGAGFGMAADNDAPFAEKGHVIASAFLGLDMKCARCHDSPFHETKQEDLFSIAAMLARNSRCRRRVRCHRVL